MSQCSRVSVCRAVEGINSKFEVCAVIHKVGTMKKSFYDVLIIDESGAVIVRVFPNSPYHQLSITREELIEAIGLARLFTLKVTEYEKTGERTAILLNFDVDEIDGDDRPFEVEHWYKETYKALKVPFIDPKRDLFRVDILGEVTERMYDSTRTENVKITYTVKSKDVTRYVCIWNEEKEIPHGPNKRYLLRNLRKDYFRQNAQFTMDELSDVIPVDTGTVSDVSAPAVTPVKRRKTIEDDPSIIPLVKKAVTNNPTAGVQQLMIVMDRIQKKGGTVQYDAWLQAVMKVVHDSLEDSRNREIISKYTKNMMKEIRHIPVSAVAHLLRFFEGAVQSADKKIGKSIETELLLLVAAMNNLPSEDEEAGKSENEEPEKSENDKVTSSPMISG